MKEIIEKMMRYVSEWDTEQHGFVLIETDGRLIPTNNSVKGIFTLNKLSFLKLIDFLVFQSEKVIKINNFIYVASVNGGFGPDTWDDEIIVRAEDIGGALDYIETNHLPFGANVTSIEQDDGIKPDDPKIRN